TSIAPCVAPPRRRAMGGATYWSQSVRRWKNLSAPARIGATVKPTRKIWNACRAGSLASKPRSSTTPCEACAEVDTELDAELDMLAPLSAPPRRSQAPCRERATKPENVPPRRLRSAPGTFLSRATHVRWPHDDGGLSRLRPAQRRAGGGPRSGGGARALRADRASLQPAPLPDHSLDRAQRKRRRRDHAAGLRPGLRAPRPVRGPRELRGVAHTHRRLRRLCSRAPLEA